ncbi:hypothetical protein B0H13DRAFT_2656419 [Mycena leptocephala]|nr:hypothetical protein B0H13DRAFT_2656419 [Mycena leptocephala]
MSSIGPVIRIESSCATAIHGAASLFKRPPPRCALPSNPAAPLLPLHEPLRLPDARAPVRSGRAALTRPVPRRSTLIRRSLTRTTTSPLDLNAVSTIRPPTSKAQAAANTTKSSPSYYRYSFALHPFSSMLSTSLASPASIPLLQTLNMNILTHIRMCRWNPNALAHDVLASIARPPSAMDLDYCGNPAILVRSLPRSLVLFLLLPRPLPPRFSFTVTSAYSTFDPLHILMSSSVFPNRPAPQHESTAYETLHRYALATPLRVCCPTATLRPEHRTTRTPCAHHNPLAPPALALPATYVPSPPTAIVSCAMRSRRSKLSPPCTPNVHSATPSACATAAFALPGARRRLLHRVPGSREHHRSTPAVAARCVRLGRRLLRLVTHRDHFISASIDALIPDFPERRRATCHAFVVPHVVAVPASRTATVSSEVPPSLHDERTPPRADRPTSARRREGANLHFRSGDDLHESARGQCCSGSKTETWWKYRQRWTASSA